MKKKLLALLLTAAMVMPAVNADKKFFGKDGQLFNYEWKDDNKLNAVKNYVLTGVLGLWAINTGALLLEGLSGEDSDTIKKLLGAWATPWSKESRDYIAGQVDAGKGRLVAQTGFEVIALEGMALWVTIEGIYYLAKSDKDAVEFDKNMNEAAAKKAGFESYEKYKEALKDSEKKKDAKKKFEKALKEIKEDRAEKINKVDKDLKKAIEELDKDKKLSEEDKKKKLDDLEKKAKKDKAKIDEDLGLKDKEDKGEEDKGEEDKADEGEGEGEKEDKGEKGKADEGDEGEGEKEDKGEKGKADEGEGEGEKENKGEKGKADEGEGENKGEEENKGEDEDELGGFGGDLGGEGFE